MLYRRKLLLALLEQSGGSLGATQLQKYMFEVCRAQDKGAYAFVPYRFGCYSFDLAADLKAMKTRTWLKSTKSGRSEQWTKQMQETFFPMLHDEDKQIVQKVYKRLDGMSYRTLIRHIYLEEPYYATRSEIAVKYLTKDEQRMVDKSHVRQKTPILMSIGYEGRSLDEFLNKLLLHDIELLCDIRRNAFSMKRGFSKSQLQQATEQVGIHYVHLPELGIESEKRQHLETREDYNELFKQYRRELENKEADIEHFHSFFAEYNRIAVMCFEADHTLCHRDSFVNKYIAYFERDDLAVVHL